MAYTTLPWSMEQDRQNQIKASSTHVDDNFNTLLSSLNNKMDKDGSVTATADMPMGSHKITGLATPTASGDATNKGYVDNKVTDLDNRTVKLSGDQRISGSKTFVGIIEFDSAYTGGRGFIYQQQTAGQLALGLQKDDNSEWSQNNMQFTPNAGTNISATTNVSLSGSTPATTNQQPAASSATNGTYIATTGWVNDSAKSTNVVHRNGTETITGNKTFSNEITGSISGNAGTVTNGVYTKGDQTIEGNKTFTYDTRFTKSAPQIVMKDTHASADVKNQSLTENHNGPLIRFVDKNGKDSAYIYTAYEKNGNVTLKLQANRLKPDNTGASASIGVILDKKGNASSYAVTPATTSNDASIATTAWVRSVALGAPNYAAKVQVSNPWTATANGFVFNDHSSGDIDQHLYIGGVEVAGCITGRGGYHVGIIPIAKGDVLSCTGHITALWFVPFK